LSEDHKDEQNTEEKKVKIEEDGKATPTDETVEKIEEIQKTDPKVQTTSEPSDSPASELNEEAEKEAKAKAAAEARAERAKARAAKKAEEEEVPKEPSPLQPRLDRIIEILKKEVSDEAVEESFINDKDRDLPCLVVRREHWHQCAVVMKKHEELHLNYLRNVSGVDYETHMEVVYHLLCLSTKHEYCVKVRTDRDQPSIPSVTPIWSTANWNEREIFDLYGIDFPGHPDMRRIMMSDDWVGHPLRKDYEAFDPEV
jgi:NADH-quinone oxidoreductase subunit C